MKKLTLLICLMLFSISSYAQNTFYKTYGFTNNEVCYHHIQTSDNGYIMVGETAHGTCSSDEDILYIKVNYAGNVEWAKRLEGINAARAFSIKETNDFGFVITGYSVDTTDYSNCSIVLIKTNYLGDTLWTRKYGDYYYTNSYEGGRMAQQTADGGYIITGFGNDPFGRLNTFLLKTDSIGNVLWTKTYGNNNYENVTWIEQTSDLGYIIAGTSGVAPGLNNMFLIKTDSYGDTLWTKTYSDGDVTEGMCVKQTMDNGYIFLGNNDNINTMSTDLYVVKTDESGNINWAKTYGGQFNEQGASIDCTTEGGYIISGVTNSFGAGDLDIYLLKIDKNGDTLWTKTYGGIYQDVASSVIQTNDGGFSIAGYTESYGVLGRDFCLIKTDSNGYCGCNEFRTNTIINDQVTFVHSGMAEFSSPTLNWHYEPLQFTSPTISCSTECEGISVEENTITDKEIKVYPNPTSENITIETNEKSEIEISNIAGQLIKTITTAEKQTSIDVSDLSGGIYIIKAKTEKGVAVKKFIKE